MKTRLFLCQSCKGVLRGKAEADGGRLRTVDLQWLCPYCLARAMESVLAYLKGGSPS